MPTMDETRSKLTGGATKEELIQEGHSPSSISKAQKQLQKSPNGVSNGHVAFANLTTGMLSAPAQKTQELAEEVRQAKLNQELSALQGGGSDVQQLRSEVMEMRQAMRDQQHREELGRLEAKITVMEGRVIGSTPNQSSALETLLQPLSRKTGCGLSALAAYQLDHPAYRGAPLPIAQVDLQAGVNRVETTFDDLCISSRYY